MPLPCDFSQLQAASNCMFVVRHHLRDVVLQVMASDGLWDVMSNADVVSIIKDTVKEAGMCSKRLATEAAARGSKDNITVIVVFLRPVSTAERIY